MIDLKKEAILTSKYLLNFVEIFFSIQHEGEKHD